MNRALLALTLTLPLMGSAMGQTPPPPCAGPEFRQMDFWLGRWQLRWEATPGQAAGSGTNHITRELGACVIKESFQGGAGPSALVGVSLSTYAKPRQQWRQTWVDNQGGYIELAGGMEAERFVLMTPLAPDARTRSRMLFEDIRPDSLTWRWQRSSDAGASWSDQWVIFYKRLPE